MPLLIVAAWVVLWVVLAGTRHGLREAALIAYTGVAVAVLGLTEALSLFRALSYSWLTLAWAVVATVLVVALWRCLAPGLRSLREAAAARSDWLDILVAGVLSVFALGTLLSALLYPVTNYDSLTYHMPRVFFWFQNRSVAHYPTAEGRQLFSSALVEYFVLNLKVLMRGSDRLANTAQWLSYVFSIVAVSVVAEKLGASRRGQQAAAIAAAAVPMAILQASTTQNDLTCALWSLVAVGCIVSFINERPAAPGFPVWWVLVTGSAIALAFQSKPPAYLFLAPFLLWLAVASVRREGWRRSGLLAVSLALVVVALGAGWYTRNAMALDGDVLGLNAPGNTHILIKDRGPKDVVTTALKNSSMMLGTPLRGANESGANAVRFVAWLYRGNLENPRTKEDAEQAYEIRGEALNHNIGPGPLTALLVIMAALLVLLVRDAERGPGRWYAACVGVALFLTAGLITWNYFINRVLLGVLLLGVPLIGVALGERRQRSRRIFSAVLVSVLALSVAWGGVVMLLNTTNRLIPPGLIPFKTSNRDLGFWNTSYDNLLFRSQVPMYERPFKQIAAVIERSGIRRIGIDDRAGNFPIYPLLALLSDRELGYVGHVVLPARGGSSRFSPEAVVEILWKQDYPGRASRPGERGELLLQPIDAGPAVLIVYRIR